MSERAPASGRSIGRLLVANRGEIARRICNSAKAMGIETVAVHSDPDADMPFVREADLAVPLGGTTSSESYLDIDALIGAALRAGADAVHPGYGFLSESADFARAVIAAGLIWVGPSPEAIEAMGSKIEARRSMEAAGVPILPGAILDRSLPDPSALEDEIGLPLMIKASSGGGGRGMRVVCRREELAGAIEAAAREAAGAFGDDTLFVERYLEGARHVEIQIFGDRTGQVISLFERDCSVQRRHQKIIEEAPSPAVDRELRRSLGEAAVMAGEALDYVGAGTVEFLVVPGGDFFFLEVNTRLQVEHPVTESITGLDLVALQLRVASGEQLPPEAQEAEIEGHAIEARVYAEDPANSFLPVSGTVSTLRFPDTVRVDSGVESGSSVSPYYDPLIAKVIAHGPTREEARAKLAASLSRAHIDGLTTNRDFLVGVLESADFRIGDVDTGFLERNEPAELARPAIEEDGVAIHAAAAAIWEQDRARRRAPVLAAIPSGWRNNHYRGQLRRYLRSDAHRRSSPEAIEVTYELDRRGSLHRIEVGDRLGDEATVKSISDDAVEIVVDGMRHRVGVRPGAEGIIHTQSVLGTLALEPTGSSSPVAAEDSVSEGRLASPMPGAVLKVMAAAGDEVEAGQTLAVLEAMKMEHEIVAPHDGTVTEMMVSESDQVEARQVLAVLEARAPGDPGG